MKLLFFASECAPFIKTGGLGDVVGALPQALVRECGHEVRVMLPKYEDIPDRYREAMRTIRTFTVWLGWRSQYCGIQELEADGIRVYFIDNEYYFRRRGAYGYGDDAERFAFFCKAALEALPHLNYRPDVLHAHDWQTGLIPFLLRRVYAQHPAYRPLRTVYTIHNLKYQGVFPMSCLADFTGLPDAVIHDLAYYGSANCMKAGILDCDRLTTVSPRYAEEIRRPETGEGLDGLLRAHEGKLCGILNGIDTDSYDPARDSALKYPYTDSLADKRRNKTELQRALGLEVDEQRPLFGMVTRLVPQKGLDLIREKLQDLLGLQLQVVVLGAGDYEYEQFLRQAAEAHPRQAAVRLGFDDVLARQIYAASDFFLMPSRFEPCGIGQLLALRYRAVPVVRETGGLLDTVQAFNAYTGEGNGFSFTHPSADDLFHTVRYALEIYRDEGQWRQLHRNIAETDVSWANSARRYDRLYRELVPDRRTDALTPRSV